MLWLTRELVVESICLLSSSWQDGNSLDPKFAGITFEGEKVRTVHLYLQQQIDMLSYGYVLGNITLFYIPKHVIIYHILVDRAAYTCLYFPYNQKPHTNACWQIHLSNVCATSHARALCSHVTRGLETVFQMYLKEGPPPERPSMWEKCGLLHQHWKGNVSSSPEGNGQRLASSRQWVAEQAMGNHGLE